MKGTPAIYLGRIVDKNTFRAVVYGTEGKKKLVKSWNEFEAAMESGIWFPTREDALESVADEMPKSTKPRPKSKPRPKPKAVKVEEIEQEDDDILADGLDDMVYEVKNG